MASSVIQKLRGLADSGQNTQLQIQLRDAVRSGQINKQQANKLFADLVPRATKNQKPPEPLSPSELSNLRSKISNQDGFVSAGLLSRAVQTGQVSKEEANEFARSAQANRKPRGPSRDPSTANKSFADLANKTLATGPGKLRPTSSFSQDDLDRFNKRQADARFNFGLLYGQDALQPITTFTRVEDIPRYTQEEIRQMNIERLKANPKSKFNRDKLPKGPAFGEGPQNQKVPQAVVDSYNSLIGKFRNLRDTGDQSSVNRQDFENVLNSLRDSPAEFIQPGEEYSGPAFENVDGSLLRDDPSSIFSTGKVKEKQAAPRQVTKGKPNTGIESNKKIIAALNKSKAFKSVRPSPKVVNRPETKPDPFADNTFTDNVTKPNRGGAARPQGPNATEYEKKIAKINADTSLNKQQKRDLAFNLASDEYGPGFDRGQFKFLLDRLTGSKIRQNRDAQSQERQNIYTQGLSSMFANF